MDKDQKKLNEELKVIKSKMAHDEERMAKDETKLISEEKEIRRLKLSLRGLIALILIVAAIGGAILAYLTYENRSVSIEKSDIE